MQKLDFPNRITVELTNRCNVSCTFCHRQKFPMEFGDMEETLFYKIVDEAAQHLPVKIVIFFRGESLLNPNLIPYIKYAKEKGLGPIQLASNALILDQKMSEDLVQSGIDFISFSLDTLDKEIYQETRLSGNLEKSMDNVKYLGELCKKKKCKSEFVPTLQVSTIDLDCYRPIQEKFITYWKQYVDIVRIYYEHDENGQFVDPEIQKLLIWDSERKPCRKVFTDMIIYWNGHIALCNYDWNQKMDFGDIKSQSLSEVWNGEVYEKIRQMHINNNFEEHILCKSCHHWKSDYIPEGYLGKVF